MLPTIDDRRSSTRARTRKARFSVTPCLPKRGNALILLLLFAVLFFQPAGGSAALYRQAAASDDGPLRVLFIGNSLTYVNDLPSIFAQMVNAGRDRPAVVTSMVAEDSATLKSLWSDEAARAAIRSQDWDYVILQEQSRLGVADEQELSLTGSADQFFRYARLFDSEIRRRGARTVLLSTWTHKDSPHEQVLLDRAYRSIAEELEAVLIPAGAAWTASIHDRPDIELYADNVHPNERGSFLAAATAAATLMPPGFTPPERPVQFQIRSAESHLQAQTSPAEFTLPEDIARYLTQTALEVARSTNTMPAPGSCTLAITNVTVIDGTDSRPFTGATVTIERSRIASIDSAAHADVSACDTVIDGRGKFLTPGFIDTNVHVAMVSREIDHARYFDRLSDIAIEGAQLHLKFGVTSIRDSYGMLQPLLDAREAIGSGRRAGATLYVAGNILGYGGHFADSFRSRGPQSYFEEWLNDQYTRGSGEELRWMTPEKLREAVNAYLDLGVDFLKVGLSDHDHNVPSLMFSPRQLAAIVETAHARGIPVDVHATTPEAVVIAVGAGVDLIQHPEVMGVDITDEALALLDAGTVFCSMHGNNYTGEAWKRFLKTSGKSEEQDSKKAAEQISETKADSSDAAPTLRSGWAVAGKTGESRKKELRDDGPKVIRRNAEKIVASRCPLTIATDNAPGQAPEFLKDPNEWRARQPGLGTLASIEAIVELGGTPKQALIAATRNGALALRRLHELGTVERGKIADLVLLDADPLADIGNVRAISAVIKNGKVVNRDGLPDKPVFYGPPRATPSVGAR